MTLLLNTTRSTETPAARLPQTGVRASVTHSLPRAAGVLQTIVFTTVKNSRGEEITIEDEDHLLKASRFTARKNNNRGVGPTKENLESVNDKLAELKKRGEQGSAEYKSLESVKDGLEVSLILQGDENLPQGVSAPYDYLIEIAKQTDLDSAYDAISSLKNAGRLNDSSKKEIQENFLSNLNDEQLSQALGGDSGPFADALEIINDEICPNIPLNGEMAGQKIGPGDSCPYPVDPGVKQTLRNHTIQMMSDHYIINPSKPLSSSYEPPTKNKNKNNKKDVDRKTLKKHERMKQILTVNPEQFQKILTQGTEQEQEDSLAYLIYQMSHPRRRNQSAKRYATECLLIN